jgi:DNA modification methylase
MALCENYLANSQKGIHFILGDAEDPESYSSIEKVHSVIFDPPFFAKKQGFRQIRKKNKTQLDEIYVPKDFPKYWNAICSNCRDLIEKTGWFIHKADFHTMMLTHPITLKYFDFIGDTIWNKKRIGTGYYIRKQHEYIIIYRPKGARNSFTLQRPMRKGLKSTSHGSSKGKAFRSIQEVLNSNGGEFGQKKRKHINQTEIELWKKYISFFVPIGKSVLDIAMGSGSIGKTCKILGNGYYGIDIKPEFLQIAKKSINSVKKSEKITEFFMGVKV